MTVYDTKFELKGRFHTTTEVVVVVVVVRVHLQPQTTIRKPLHKVLLLKSGIDLNCLDSGDKRNDGF